MYEKLEVIPGAISPSISVLSANGRSFLATAGVPVYLILQLKDSWGNPGRPHPISDFAIVLISPSFSRTLAELDATDNILASSSSSSISPASDPSMPGGLTATYYKDFDSLLPVIVSCQASGSWSHSHYCGGVDASASLFVKSGKLYTRLNNFEIGSPFSWSVRYKGSLLTSQPGNYTFIFHKTACERCAVTFFVNGSSISFNTANNLQTMVSAAISINHAMVTHDVLIRYQQEFHLETMRLEMMYSYNSQTALLMPTSNMFPLAGKFFVKATPQLTPELSAEMFIISRNPALTATFYSQLNFESKLKAFRVQEYNTSFFECGVDCMPLDPVLIRWSGFYKHSAVSTVSVFFGGSFCQSSLKLWLDDILYADLIQPSDGRDASRYINFPSRDPRVIHAIRIEYSKMRGDAVFALNFTENGYSTGLGEFYSSSSMISSVGKIEVMSSIACASRSTLSVQSAFATAGHAFSCTVSVLDTFGNAINSVIVPNASLSLGSCNNLSSLSPAIFGSAYVSYIGMNLYNVTARVTALSAETNVCLQIFLTLPPLDYLNYTVRVFPDVPCASLSRAVGSCLSLGEYNVLHKFVSINESYTSVAATAGMPCRFSIIARDSFGNIRLNNANHEFFYQGQGFTRIPSSLSVSSTSFPPPPMLDIRTISTGQQRLSVLLSGSRGVFVEYFAQGMYWASPFHSEISLGILPQEHLSKLAGSASLMMSQYSWVAVRWTGYLNIMSPQSLTFMLDACEDSTLYV
jgi:hypothetical protein